MKNTKIPIGRFSMAALALAAIFPSSPGAELVPTPRKAGTSIDIGQAFKDGEKNSLTRTGVYLTTGGTYDGKLEVIATLGGLFWYAFPEQTSSSRLVKFGPGVGQAQAIYSFGDPESPYARLRFGLFPNKYNQDSRNLGEYLYRSGAYPGYLWTGGWSYLNASSYLAQGLKLELPTFNGSITHYFTLFMERDAIAPIHDFSPGWMMTAKAGSAFEFGTGVVWQNGLSFNPDRLAPKTANNAYSKRTNLPVMGATDSATLDTTQWDYYTFRGFKAMARAAVDLGTLLDLSWTQPRDFSLYTEIALLGIENQPYYYERRSERMPMMAGISIPTFGLLSKLSIEAEYYKSRYPNTIYFPFGSQQGLPIPLSSDGGEASPADFSDSAFAADKKKFTADDWKWSVYANRKLTEGITLHAQAASDHLRHFNSEAKPDSKPFTLTPSDWYYVVRLEFGLF
jgi:hypothetical protein